jgi:hypothetical protein
MRSVYSVGRNPIWLFITAQVLLLISFAWKDFPVFIFVAFAPVFALIDHPFVLKESYRPFFITILLSLIFYFSMQNSIQSGLRSWIIYFIALAVIFTAYVYMQRLTYDRLNKFALVIFILGIEYAFLKLMSKPTPVFLADVLRHKATWIRWNSFTGYSGVTFWILFSNLLFYQALFKEHHINWRCCLIASLVVLAPIAYSFTLPETYATLEKAEVLRFYSHNGLGDATYSAHGELISRTGAWVSPLIIIFTLIKGMTKKGSR